MTRYRILYVERYQSVKREVLPALMQDYNVITAEIRRDAIEVFERHKPDLVLLNVASMRFDVVRFCDDIREQNPNILVFMLLSKGTRLDQIPRTNGYLRHPFTTRQLLRRLERVLPQQEGEIVGWRGLEIDLGGRFLCWDTEQVPLTPKQAALALAFLNEPEVLLSRARLMQEVWGTDYMGDTRTLDVHIHWFRKALTAINAPFVLKTKRGKGYRLITLLPDETEET